MELFHHLCHQRDGGLNLSVISFRNKLIYKWFNKKRKIKNQNVNNTGVNTENVKMNTLMNKMAN